MSGVCLRDLRFYGSISLGWASLGMGQGGCVQGPPQFSPSCRRVHCLQGGDEQPMAITADRSQKRKVKSDPMKTLRSSLDFSGVGETATFGYSGPLLKAEPPLFGGQTHMQRVPFLSLLAGVSATGWGLTETSTNTTWYRLGYKHIALWWVQVPTPARSCLGPDAKAGREGLP
ncbi:hypothetical protein VULLAG_LOCUS8468 [Vulpes lagopus]